MPEEIRPPLQVRHLGQVPYGDALKLQEGLVARRRTGEIPDQLLLLEHPPVITLGASSETGNVLLSPETLARMGIELYEVGRGGDVTYHGPGQLVGYPILDLSPDRRDLHRYLRDLEESLILWRFSESRRRGSPAIPVCGFPRGRSLPSASGSRRVGSPPTASP
jgi:lipoate-protein ligase B